MSLVRTPRVEVMRDLRNEITHNYGVGRTIVAVDGIPGSGTASFSRRSTSRYPSGQRCVSGWG